MTRIKPPSWMILLYVAAALFRLMDLGAAQFWYDESFSVLLSRQDLPSLLAATAADTHPPLYYLLIWLIQPISGGQEWIYRLPSVLFSLVSIWLTGRLVDQLQLSKDVKFAAMLFMVLSPVQVFFSQEARMYALLQALVLAWTLVVLQRRWRLAAILGTLALYSHNYAIIYGACLALVAMAGELRRPRLLDVEHNPYPDKLHWRPGDESNMPGAAMTFVIPAVLYIPWILSLLSQLQWLSGGFWIGPVNLGSVVDVFCKILMGFYIPEPLMTLSALVVIGLLAFSTFTAWRSSPRLLYLLGFVPLVLAVVISIAWRPMLLFRALLPSAPFLAVLILQAFSSSARRWWILAALVLPLLVLSLANHYPANVVKKGTQQGLISTIRAAWQPGDIVYHASDSTAVRWLVYARDLTQFIMPECPNQRTLGALSAATRQALNFPILPLDQIEHSRAWVVWSAGPNATQCEYDLVEQLTQGAPPIIGKDELFAHGGLWILEP